MSQAGLEVRPGLVIPPEALEVSFARAGGPGGQHVNKTSSKVLLRLELAAWTELSEEARARLLARIPPRFLTKKGEVLVSSDEQRDQSANRRACEEKLVEVLRQALARPKTRRKTKPTRGSQERRIEAKKRAGKRKEERGGGW